MQQFSNLFCDECGAANEAAATHCVACQSSLAPARAALSAPPKIAPVNITPLVQEVTAGPAIMPVDFKRGMILAGRYRIREEIGRGGFSIVYRAEEVGTRRQVAIKRIYLRALTPRQIIDATETFNREVKTLSRFKYVSGIPRFYEHLTDPENWYLVMEYVDGQTLEDYLCHAPDESLSERETLNIGIELAQILQELHSVDPPIIFRDVKPANIMITPERELYLIDFGIARVFTPGKTKDTTPLGSPGYAPPEQYGRAQTDQRADIYSLGATMQTLFTGRDPVELAAGEPSRNPKKLSRAVQKLLDDMMEPDLAKRPPDLGKVKRRMEFIRQGFLPWWRRVAGVALVLWGAFACVGNNAIPSLQELPVFPIMTLILSIVLIVWFISSRLDRLPR